MRKRLPANAGEPLLRGVLIVILVSLWAGGELFISGLVRSESEPEESVIETPGIPSGTAFASLERDCRLRGHVVDDEGAPIDAAIVGYLAATGGEFVLGLALDGGAFDLDCTSVPADDYPMFLQVWHASGGCGAQPRPPFVLVQPRDALDLELRTAAASASNCRGGTLPAVTAADLRRLEEPSEVLAVGEFGLLLGRLLSVPESD